MGGVLINWKRDKWLVFTALDSTQYNMIVLGGCTGSDFTRVGVRPSPYSYKCISQYVMYITVIQNLSENGGRDNRGVLIRLSSYYIVSHDRINLLFNT